MTIFGFLCGSSVAPPKSPGPRGECSQREDPAACNISAKQNDNIETAVSQDDKAMVVVKTTSGGTSIDCSALMDKAVPTSQPDQSGKDTAFQVVTKEDGGLPTEGATENEDGGALEDEELARVFSFDILNQLRSKAWDDRARALQQVRERVEGNELGDVTPEELYMATADAVKALLADRVMPVYLGALELSRLLLVDFAARHELGREVVERHADKLLPLIVDKTSDRNTRSIEATNAAIMAMAKALGCRCVMQHVLPHGVEPVSTAKESAAIRGRLEVMEQLIDTFGISKSCGVSLSAVMGWVRNHLEAADEKVRHAAVEVTVSCYMHKGDRTRGYVANLKPALVKILDQRFAEAEKYGNKGKVPKKRGTRKLPALKGQQGQQRMTSRSSCRSTSSSSSGRQSSSAGSTDGNKRMAPLRGGLATSSPSFASLRSPMSNQQLPGHVPEQLPGQLPAPTQGDLYTPPAMHVPTGNDPMSLQYVDKFGTAIPGESNESIKDMLDREDEAFMKELEGLC